MSNPEDDRLSGHEKLHPVIKIAARPAVVFATTSSSDSCADDFYNDDRSRNKDDDINLEDCNKLIEGNFDDENEESKCEQNRREPPRFTAATKPKVCFWRRRIAELFLIKITLYAVIVIFFHSSNRLSLNNATIVSGSEPLTLPSSNMAALMSIGRNIDDAKNGPEDCIYVPGGGFSGFWFSLGRLQSIEHPHNETFVCFSAGCLGVVATLLHHGELLQNRTVASRTNNDLYIFEMARSLQIEWQTGERHRYRVVEGFIDGLLKKLENLDEESRQLFVDTITSNLNVVTTAFEQDESKINVENQRLLLPQSILPRAFIRRPSDISSLKRLLLQSSWIPLATGSSWTHKGHMDGGISLAQHPECSRTVGLTEVSVTNTDETDETSSWLRNQILLLGNILNIHLSREDASRLWKIGMSHGV